MTKAEAINTLLQCSWLDQACRTVAGELWRDLKQEFWLHILEKDPLKFECIRDPERSLMFWSAKIMWTIYLPKTNGTSDKKYPSKFQKTYRVEADIDIHSINDDDDTHKQWKQPAPEPDNKQHIETFADFAQSHLGPMPFYERVLFALHLEGKSDREIQRETQIDRKEVGVTIRRVKKEIETLWKKSPHYKHFLQD